MHMTFEEAKRYRDELESEGKSASKILHSFPSGKMGMHSDEVKNDPIWKAAKAREAKTFKALQTFNKQFVKVFKKELAMERNNKYRTGNTSNRRGNASVIDTLYETENTHVPLKIKKAIKLVEEFHGRPYEEIVDGIESEKYDSTVSQLAILVELTVLSTNGKNVIPIRFQDSDVVEDKQNPNNVLVCANPTGTQLYIMGGDQDIGDPGAILEQLGQEHIDEMLDRDLVPLGDCYSICYFTDKHHLVGPKSQAKGTPYNHEFGENDIKEGYEPTRPILIYDQRNKNFKLIGGSYRIEDVGIVN